MDDSAVSTLFRACVAVSIALACLVVATSAGEAAPDRPNILFFLTDDQPQVCLGAMGNTRIHTPNMDRLAEEGVLFTNAFVTTSICCSNRACILTG
jgi:arylsulfatase A-like enzyme